LPGAGNLARAGAGGVAFTNLGGAEEGQD